MLLMIDNYDSFTYNLVQYLRELGAEVQVKRNDEVSIAQIEALHPSHIVLSPGPCSPLQAGICVELIQRCVARIPILGVCLGHQSIAAAFAGSVVRARRVMHGKTSTIHHDGRGLFQDLPAAFTAIRYHSLVAAQASLPACLEVSATAEDGEVMGLRYRGQCGAAPLEGVQFHPESVLSEHGHALLENFLHM